MTELQNSNDDVLNGRKVIAEWMTLGKKNVVLPREWGRQLSSNIMSTLYVESVDRRSGFKACTTS